MAQTDLTSAYLSAVTIAELQRGISLLSMGRRRARIEHWFSSRFLADFRERVLPFDVDVARRYGALQAGTERAGARLPVLDAMIAATALEHNLAVVTRNTRDFKRTGVQVIDPWR
jgi:predicted nucleic acid-binding protein